MENKNILLLKKSQHLLGALSVGAVALLVKCFVYPFQRGFFCGDESLRFPAHSSTISSEMLYLFIFSTTLTVMTLCEYNRSDSEEESWSIKFGEWTLPSWTAELYGDLGEYWFGEMSCELLTLVSKLATGRLRPHFIQVCDPYPSCGKSSDKYMGPQEFTCRGRSSKDLIEARKSFPSGHASLAAFTALYLCFYLEVKMDPIKHKILKHVLQLLFITMSLITGFTRINDNKHHWSDVAAGFVLGMILAVLNAFYVSSLFVRDKITTNPPKAVKR